MNRDSVDPSRLGIVAVIVGVVALLSLRVWASPVADAVTGRTRVSIVAFLAIPLALLLIGVGIVLFVWGPEFVN